MRILREPLAHFLVLGAAIFACSRFINRGGSSGGGAGASGTSDKIIVVTMEKVALLKSGFVLDNRRDPTEAELQRLIDAFVREEVLVRAARTQGLDRDDSIVRRRLVQKMEFAVTEPEAPSQADLTGYLAQHPETFRTPDGKIPALADIHNAVQAEWTNQQRSHAIDEMYRAYRAEFQISVEMPATRPASGAGS